MSYYYPRSYVPRAMTPPRQVVSQGLPYQYRHYTPMSPRRYSQYSPTYYRPFDAVNPQGEEAPFDREASCQGRQEYESCRLPYIDHVPGQCIYQPNGILGCYQRDGVSY